MANKPDMTKPRQKKHNIDDIPNEKQRQLLAILKPYFDKSGLTMRQIANTPPTVSLATLSNLYSPSFNKVPTPRILELLAQKISNIFSNVNAESLYNTLLEVSGYNSQLNPYGSSYQKRVYPNRQDLITISVTDYQIMQGELTRANTTIQQIFNVAKKVDNKLVWNSDDIAIILKLAYPHIYNEKNS